MPQSENVAQLIEALTKAQTEFTTVPKTKTGREGNREFKYADLADVVGMITPKLSKQGIFLSQPLVLDKDGEHLRQTTRLQLGEQFIQTDGIRIKDSSGAGKSLGVEVTYARRIDLNGLLAIAPDEDMDAPDLDTGTPPPSGSKPTFAKKIDTLKQVGQVLSKVNTTTVPNNQPPITVKATDFPFGENVKKSNTATVGGAAPGGNPEITNDDLPQELSGDSPAPENQPLSPDAEDAAQAMDAPETLTKERYDFIQERLKEISSKKLAGVTTKGLSAFLESRHNGKKLVYVPAVTAENTLALVEEAVAGGPARVKELFNSVKEKK